MELTTQIHEFTLCMDKVVELDSVENVIAIRQGDHRSHILKIALIDEDDAAITIPSGTYAMLAVPATYAQSIELQCTLVDNVAVATLPSAISTIQSSTDNAYVKLVNEAGEIISTSESFGIHVIPGAGEVDEIIDVNDFSPYLEIRRAEDAANEAAANANTKAEAAQAATDAAIEATQNADSATTRANTATEAAIEATTDAIEATEDSVRATAAADAVANNMNIQLFDNGVVTVTDKTATQKQYLGLHDAVEAANNLDAWVDGYGVVKVVDRNAQQTSYDVAAQVDNAINPKIQAAEEATSAANSAASNANSKATAAQTAADNANAATTAANAATSLASEATTAANNATQNATDAADAAWLAARKESWHIEGTTLYLGATARVLGNKIILGRMD